MRCLALSDLAFGRYAAIDIGTVTCRLLIADIQSDGLHERAHGYGITNLGEGVDTSGFLTDAAMSRVTRQVSQFLDLIATYRDQDHPYIEIITVATSASRDAKNADEFMRMLQKLGLKVSVISGEKEANLSFLGASHNYRNENLLVVDVGGGSTEISAGVHGREPFLSRSIDLGCKRLTERFLPNEPPHEAELAAARMWVKENLEDFFNEMKKANFHIDKMIAVAGTATSLVSIHQKMAHYDREKVHGATVLNTELSSIYKRLRIMGLEERKQVVGLDPKRAHVIVAGLLILQEVLSLSGCLSFVASDADVLQGIILDASQNRQ